MKKKRFIIWLIVATLLVLGTIAPIAPVAIRTMQNTQNEYPPAARLYTKVNFREVALQSFSVPITWGFINSGESTEGIGLNLFAVKKAFPHEKDIFVVLAGKAFYKKGNEVQQSDAEVRVALSVIPDNGWLSVTNVSIDTINFFDFSDTQQKEFLLNQENIVVELEKHISTKLLKIPAPVKRIYEMTNDQIIFFVE